MLKLIKYKLLEPIKESRSIYFVYYLLFKLAAHKYNFSENSISFSKSF